LNDPKDLLVYKATTTAALQRRVVQAVRTRLCLAAIRQWPAAAAGGGDGAAGSSVPAGPNILARQHVNLLDGFDEFTEDQSKKG
jgi:hypothetical protein